MSVVAMTVVQCTECGRRWETMSVPERCPFCEGNCEAGEHDKEYSGQVLLSNPPQYPWRCRRCGVQGRDMDKSDQPMRIK